MFLSATDCSRRGALSRPAPPANTTKSSATLQLRLRPTEFPNAEIRLGWEANGDWFPWSAGSQPELWKQCFTRIANVWKSESTDFRICWSLSKKGRIDVRTIWPEGAPITNICLSHYDDAYDRLGTDTYKGGCWGLRCWLQFVKDQRLKNYPNLRLAFGEWGVGRAGDNPQYIQDMRDFFVEAGSYLAHEAYNNSGKFQLYPVNKLPKSSSRYQQLF